MGASVAAAQARTGARVRIGLNAYSFNQPLRDGKMTLEDVVDFCAEHGIDALDATGYYFPGYPKVPSDETIFRLKKRAFLKGVSIHGTGVRNDFAAPDAAARAGDLRMVKEWIDVAVKLGAPVIRVFAGRRVPDARAFEQALEWMVPLFKECTGYGRARGVIVGLQNHDDFVRTAEETIRLVKAVDSEWFGVILDVGSLRRHDPYEEIAKLIPYAVSWQLKEAVWYGDKETPTDFRRVRELIEKGGYRGIVPIETLGPGDPRVKLEKLLGEVRAAFG
jgi:sugar phosphate isomerase/epimerase